MEKIQEYITKFLFFWERNEPFFDVAIIVLLILNLVF